MEFRVAALADLRTQFVGALDAEVGSTTRPRSHARWRGFDRSWAIPALATALVLVVAAVLAFPSREDLSVTEAAAAISQTALHAPYPPDNWYTYTDSLTTSREYEAKRGSVGAAKTVERRRRAWLSVAQAGLIVNRDLSEPDATPVRVPYPAATKYEIGGHGYSRSQIDAFAIDPTPLLDQIDETVADVERELQPIAKWQILSEALRGVAPPLPAALRASLIRELATVSGAKIVDADRDPAGVLATGLQLRTQGVIDTVYFDESSAAMSFASTIAASNGASGDTSIHKGDVIESYQLNRSEAVRSIPNE
jgi:hypothetical protein